MYMTRYFMVAALVLFPVSLSAQMHGSGMHGGSGQQMMSPDNRSNEDTMKEMTRDKDHLRSQDSMTPEHQREGQQMNGQSGDMRQQMKNSQGGSMQGQQ